MNHSETITELAKALVNVQSEMPPAPMDGNNPFFRSKYATLRSLIETSKPILAKYGLSVSQPIVSDCDNVGVETVLIHTSGEYISNICCVRIEPFADEFDKDGKKKSQKPVMLAGSTITFLRRYGLAAILGVYSEEEGPTTQPVRNTPIQKKTSQTANTSTPQSLNNGDSRPYSPEVLKIKISKRAMAKFDKQASPLERSRLDSLLTKIVKDASYDPSMKSDLLKFLAVEKEIEKVPGSYILALYDWLEPSESGKEIEISDESKREIETVMNYIIVQGPGLDVALYP